MTAPQSQPITLSREQVRSVDRAAIEQYHIPSIVLMENAARGAADVALRLLTGRPLPSALLVCGRGNNGGDGLAMARHLHNAGVRCEVLLCAEPGRLSEDAAVHLRIAQAMGIAIVEAAADPAAAVSAANHADMLVDALLGTGLDRPVRSPMDRLIEAIHRRSEPLLAVDIPSGLDCDSGQPLGTAVRADHTVTFVARKLGFADPDSAQYTGEVHVCGIGAPKQLIEQIASAGR